MTIPTPPSSKRRADSPPVQSTSANGVRAIKRLKLEDPGNQLQDLVNISRPRLAPFHPDFKKVENAVTELCDRVLEVYDAMTKAGNHNQALTRSCEEIRRYRNPQKHSSYPPEQLVAFAGAAGAGKSSLINALFGIGEIAITSDDVRGTNVVHEYAAASWSQVTLFQVEVCYHSRQRIEEQVTQQCQNSFTFFEKRKEMEEDADELDQDELDALNDDHNTAIEYLHTTLHDPDDEDFDSETAVEEWLQKLWLDSDPLEDVVSRIMHKINEFLYQRDVQDDLERHSAMSTSDLQDVYEQVSRPSAAKGVRRHPCRLIHTIRVRFEHPLVDDGTVFADTPGFGDASKFVGSIARQYLYHVDHIFLVAPIIRTDGTLLDPYLQQIIQMRKAKRACLVLTKIDHRDNKNSKVNGGQMSDDEVKVEEARSYKKQLEDRRSEMVAEKKALRATHRYQECVQLQQDLDDLDEELDTAKAALERARNTLVQNAVLAQNALLMSGLKDKYRKLARSSKQPDLRLFFTSSRAYDRHQQSPENASGDEKPHLDLAATGIPSLLEALYTINAQGKFKCLKNIALKGLLGELKALVSVLTKTPWDRHKQVRNDIELIHEKRSRVLLDKLSTELWASFDESVAQMFEDNLSVFEKEARKFLKTLEKMHATRFHAFCRKSGEWKNSKGNWENWNARLSLMYRATVEAGFAKMKEFCDEVVKTLNFDVEEIFQSLKRQLQARPGRTAGVTAFIAAIDRSRKAVSEQIRNTLDYFDSAIEDMLLKATFDNATSSFVGQELRQTYDAMVAITSKPSNAEGTTPVRRRNMREERLQLMKHALTGPDNVFKGVLDRLSHVAKEEINKCKVDVAAELKRSRLAILQSFDNQFQQAEPQGADSAVMMEQLLVAARAAETTLEGPVAQRIREIEMWEKDNA